MPSRADARTTSIGSSGSSRTGAAATVVVVVTTAVAAAAVAVVVASVGARSEDPRAAAMVSVLALAICNLVSIAARTHMP